MVWKKVNNADAGDADHFGGDDLDKVSDLFSGVNVDTVDLNSTTKLRKGKLKLANTANTFVTTLDGGDVTVDRTLTLPDGSDTTLVGLDSTQTLTNKTINPANNTIVGSTPTVRNVLRDNGTKFVSAPIDYYDVPRAVYTNTNDIFYRNRNTANDTNPLASYTLWTNGWSPHTGFIQVEEVKEEFSSDGWVDVGATSEIAVNTGTGKLVARCIGDNTSYASSLDITSCSDSVWTMRFRLRVTAIPDTGLGGRFYFGISSLPSSTDSNTAQDFIGLQIKEYVGDVGGNITYTVHSTEADGVLLQDTGDTSQNFTFNLNEFYQWEISRVNTTTFAIKCFGKDKEYRRQTGSTMTVTIPSTIQTLRYIKACNKVQSLAGDRTLEVDEIRLWKTVTAGSLTRATPALACNGTINNTSYFMSRHRKDNVESAQMTIGPYQPYVAEDFTRFTTQEEADYHFPTQDITKNRVSIANDRIEFTCVKDGSNDSLSHALIDGAVNDTVWEMRFKARVSGRSATTSAQAQMFVGLCSNDSGTAGSVAQDFIGFVFNANTTNMYWNIEPSVDGAVLNERALTGNVMTPDIDYYFRIARTGTITGTYSVYSDADYTKSVVQTTFVPIVTTATLNNFVVKNNNSATTADSTFTGRIEEISIVNATSGTTNPPIAGNTTWTGLVPRDPIAFALNLNKVRTTETQLKIRVSRRGVPFFTDNDTVRTINVSDFTDQIYRYIPMNKLIPVLEADAYGVYWVQVIGTNNTTDLAINAISMMPYDNSTGSPTGLKMLNQHLHYLFKKTEVDNQLDGN